MAHLLATLTVISQIWQMWVALDNIQEVGKWVIAAEEVIVAQVDAFNAIPDLHVSYSNGENFDYNRNLD